MKKIITISFLTLLLLASCNKDTQNIVPENMSGTTLNTPEGRIETTQTGVDIASGENSASMTNEGLEVKNNDSEVNLSSSGMELNSKEGNIKMDENGMTSNIPGAGTMSITNTGTQIGDINISSGNMAEDFAGKAVNDELNNLEMELDSAAKSTNSSSQTNGGGTMSQE